MKLEKNQAALVLETSENGEVTVNVASPEQDGLAGAICRAIAKKLMNDEHFQAELMEMLEEDDQQ
jgi:hypothetical protein